VKALRFDGRRSRLLLPPAAEQCGYRLYVPVENDEFGTAEPELEVIR
jgi:hypothetical protein